MPFPAQFTHIWLSRPDSGEVGAGEASQGGQNRAPRARSRADACGDFTHAVKPCCVVGVSTITVGWGASAPPRQGDFGPPYTRFDRIEIWSKIRSAALADAQFGIEIT
jgi:hypothetical protein